MSGKVLFLLGCASFVFAQNDAAIPKSKSSIDVGIGASFLYWQAREKDLELTEIIPTDIYGHKYKEVDMHFGFHPAFRVQGSLGFEQDQLELKVEYLRLHISDKKKIGLPGWASAFSDYWTLASNATNVEGKWTLHMDLLNCDFGRDYFISENFVIKPYLGLKGGWMSQKMAVKALSSTYNHYVESLFSSHSWLVGIRMGLDMNYVLPKGFSVFADNDFNLMYQNFHITGKNQVAANTSLVTGNEEKTAYLTPNFDICLGFSWESYFSQNRYYFQAKAGYEFDFYFNQNLLRKLRATTYGADAGDLMMQGLTLALKFDF